jgi:hypothetical protein
MEQNNTEDNTQGLKRKDFLKFSSLTAISAIPVLSALSKLFGSDKPTNELVKNAKIISHAYRLHIPQNLLNLEYYFINTREYIDKNGQRYLKAWYGQAESYMVVRLPQQHIIEQFFDFELTNSVSSTAVVYAQTKIAGYSYLAFRILFPPEGTWQERSKGDMPKKYDVEEERRIKLDSETLLDWDDYNTFKLVVRQNLNETIFNAPSRYHDAAGTEKQITNDSIKGFFWNKQIPIDINAYPHANGDFDTVKNADSVLGNYEQKSKFSLDYNFVPNKNVKWGLTPQRLIRDAGPVTLLEIPYRIYLSPKLPNQDDYRFKWRFTRSPEPGVYSGETELWMAALTIEKRPSKALKQSKKEKAAKDKVVDDEFVPVDEQPMQLMVLGHRRPRNKGTYDDIDNDTNFLTLPTPKDAEDLVKLYKLYRLTAKTQRLAFSPLGVSTQIHFKNTKLEQAAKNGGATKNDIDLLEWNHHISFGRDQQVEVSRLVMCHETGHKFIWIRKASRVVYYGVAMLKYEEFLESFGDEVSHKDLDNKEATNKYNAETFMAGSCFAKTRYEKKRKRIKSVFTLNEGLDKVSIGGGNNNYVPSLNPVPLLKLQDNLKEVKKAMEEGMGQVLSFWAIDPTEQIPGKPDGTDTSPKGLDLHFEMIATDWEGVEHVIKKKVCVVTTVLSEFGKQSKVKLFEPKKAVINAQAAYNKLLASGEKDIKKLKDEVAKIETEVFSATGDGNWDRLYKLFNHSVQDFAQHYEELVPHSIKAFEQQLRLRNNIQADEWMSKIQQMINHLLTDIEDKVIRRIDQEYTKLLQLYIDTTYEGQQLHNAILAYTRSKEQALQSLYDVIKNVITFNTNDVGADIKKTNFYQGVQNLVTHLQKYIAILPHVGDLTIDRLKAIEAIITTQLAECVKWATDFYDEYYMKLPVELRSELNAMKDVYNDMVDIIAKAKNYNNAIRNKIDLGRKKVTLAVNQVVKGAEETEAELRERYNQEIARMETEYVVLRGHFRKLAADVGNDGIDFFNEHSCFPQLNTAKVYIKEVNDLVNRQIPVKIKYAEDYLKNQVSNEFREIKENVAQVVAELRGDTRALIQTVTADLNAELANVANVEIANKYLSTAKHNLKDTAAQLKAAYDDIREAGDEFKGAVDEIEKQLKDKQHDLVLMGESFKNQMNDYVNNGKVEAQKFLEDMKIKILGAIPLLDVIGNNFPLPVLIRDLPNKKIIYNFTTNNLQDARLGPFAFHPVDITNLQAKGGAVFMIHIEKPLAPGQLKAYKAWAHLQNFSVGVFEDRIVVGFEKLSIYSDENTKNKTDVKISNVQFNKELNFFAKLAEKIKLPAGMELDIKPTGIAVRYAIPIPSISAGAFNMANLKFISAIELSFGKGSSSPLLFRFSINRPNDKFLMSVGIFGGRGHFEIAFAPKYIKEIDTSMDFGGILYLSLGGIASGMAYLLAGIRYRYDRDEYGHVTNEFYAIISCGAELTVFGIVSIAITFLVYLRYVSAQGKSMLEGVASVSCSIKIGFFKKSFTLTFRKVLAGTDSKGSDASYNSYIPGMGTIRLSNLLYFPPEEVTETEPDDEYHDHAGESDENAYVIGNGWVSKKYKEQHRWRIYCNSFNFDTTDTKVEGNTKDTYKKK